MKFKMGVEGITLDNTKNFRKQQSQIKTLALAQANPKLARRKAQHKVDCKVQTKHKSEQINKGGRKQHSTNPEFARRSTLT